MPNATSLAGKTVCVVDAYGLIYQSFYAPNIEMTNSRGEPSGAAYGFVRDVLAILKKVEPDYLFCAYDMRGKTFRSELYPEYKANRAATPDDLLLQFDFTREFLKGMRVPALGVEGFEADDVLATLSRLASAENANVVLVTSDKDARQLLSERVSIYLLRKDKYYREPELLNDWGIKPNQVVDFQALVGDSVDNVPGVPLIGPKVASELLVKYDTLEGVLDGVGDLKGKRYDNLRAYRDLAFLSRELTRLRDDVPLEIDWESGRLDGIDPARLRGVFLYLNFRSTLAKLDELVAKYGVGEAEPSEWFDKIEKERRALLVDSKSTASLETTNAREGSDGAVDIAGDVPLLARFYIAQYGARVKTRDANVSVDRRDERVPDGLVGVANCATLDSLPLPERVAPRAQRRVTIVDDDQKLGDLVERFRRARLVSLATITLEKPEIGATRARFATLCGLAVAFEPNESFYLPFRAPLGERKLELTDALATLRPFLESNSLAKIGYELKYDAQILLDRDIRLRGALFDVALADYLARSGEVGRTLNDAARAYLDEELFDVKKELGSGKKRTSLDALPLETTARYASDAVLTPLNAAIPLREVLRKTPQLERLLFDLETPLMETLAEMERNGIAIEPDAFRAASDDLFHKQESLEQEIRAIIAESVSDPTLASEINLNSPKQLQHLLYDELKLRVTRKTKTGPSVDAEVLEELSSEHRVPLKIVELRKLTKLRGTYLEPLPRETLPPTNRICATFNQTSTATGRLSSSDPNLQNIPARSETGKLIRAGFVPDATLGFDAFVSCDYSQIELRALAHFCGDAELRKAFEEDRDIHAVVASRLFGTTLDEVTPDMRRKAKAVNFGLVYGQTAFGLSKTLGIAASDASDYIDSFFKTYPGTLEFFDRVLEDCAHTGYVQTALGRRRAVSGVRGARGRKPLNFPERAAINAVVQGTAADIMKLATLAAIRRLKRDGWITSYWSAREDDDSRRQLAIDAPLFAQLESEKKPTRERARALLQIHDELLFETRREDANELAQIVAQEMKLGDPLSVPLKIDAAIGANWGEL